MLLKLGTLKCSHCTHYLITDCKSHFGIKFFFISYNFVFFCSRRSSVFLRWAVCKNEWFSDYTYQTLTCLQQTVGHALFQNWDQNFILATVVTSINWGFTLFTVYYQGETPELMCFFWIKNIDNVLQWY